MYILGIMRITKALTSQTNISQTTNMTQKVTTKNKSSIPNTTIQDTPKKEG